MPLSVEKKYFLFPNFACPLSKAHKEEIMKKLWYRSGLSLMAAGTLFMVFSANQGCADLLVQSDGGSSSYSSPEDSFDQDEIENKLLVSGSGEVINLEYNDLTFPARINWRDGQYFFSPDEGNHSGDRIICATSIDEREIEGDCFRSGHTCHFNYWHDSGTTIDDKDVYRLGTSTCRKAGDVGPFLVPLDNPLCGQDPFPACPSDDLFPTGPAPETRPSVPDVPASAPETRPSVEIPEESPANPVDSTINQGSAGTSGANP